MNEAKASSAAVLLSEDCAAMLALALALDVLQRYAGKRCAPRSAKSQGNHEAPLGESGVAIGETPGKSNGRLGHWRHRIFGFGVRW